MTVVQRDSRWVAKKVGWRDDLMAVWKECWWAANWDALTAGQRELQTVAKRVDWKAVLMAVLWAVPMVVMSVVVKAGKWDSLKAVYWAVSKAVHLVAGWDDC